MPKSWVGAVMSTGNVPLLGGHKVHKSSRFESEGDARHWSRVAARANTEAERPCIPLTIPSDMDPEIPASRI